MRRLSRAVAGAACVAMMAFGACSSHSASRVVVLHALASCTPPMAASSGDAGVSVAFAPGGDFAGSPFPAVPVWQPGVALPINPQTQELAAQIGSPAPSFLGLGSVPQTGDVNLLLWSATGPCAATTPAVAVGGETLGLIDPGHALLVPGQDEPYLFDLTTGRNTRLVGQALNLTGATVTPFGGKALIAGGVDVSSNMVVPTTTLFTADPSGTSGTFEPGPGLQRERALAGSVVLPSGDTLLVGGISFATPPALAATMETVGVSTGVSTLAAVALKTARVSPTVLRLTNGQIAVGGGLDQQGTLVSTIEWFDAALSTPLGVLDLSTVAGPDAGVAGTASQYLLAPLEGGAILVVIPGLATNNVLVVRACDASDGACVPEADAAISLDPVKFPLNQNATLFPAARASPVLWTGTSWVRWQPWSGEFSPTLDQNDASVFTSQGPAPLLGGTGFAALAADPGLAVWVGAAGALFGLRYDTRNAYSIDAYFDATNTAPDRLVESGGPSTFNWNQPPLGGLTISGNVKAFVTDAAYRNFTLTATMLNNLPGIILRSEDGCEYGIGGGSTCSAGSVLPTPCVLMAGQDATAGAQDATITLQRSGTSVTWAIAGSPTSSTTCTPGFASNARVSVGFRGTMPGAVISDLSIVRSP